MLRKLFAELLEENTVLQSKKAASLRPFLRMLATISCRRFSVQFLNLFLVG